jgi:subtilisin family serine protease
MSLQSAWDKTTGSDNIIIGVIDTGISLTHPDLVSNLWVNPLEVAGNGLDDDGNGYIDDVNGINAITNSGNPNDDNSHGTHVAGIIAATGNNGVGVAGVNWRAKVVGLKFLDASGSGATSNAIKCIYYSTQMKRLGYKVVASNNSWGGGGYSSALGSAIQDAASQNVLFIAAAGNSAQNIDVSPSYPASYNISNVISVASVTSTSALSSFSNYGTSVSIAAPGSSIYSTVPGGYATYSGTSMASPQVAGVAALASSACSSTFSAAQLKDIILSTGVTVATLSGKVSTSSIANANSAVIKAQTVCASATPVPPTATATATATPTRTATATAGPTLAPTIAPTTTPTAAPTVAPTVAPPATPTSVPTIAPTVAPTAIPTLPPTAVPTIQPTRTPIPTATPQLPLAISISPSSALSRGQQATISIRNTGSALSVPVSSRLVGKINNQTITFICPNYSVGTVAGSSQMSFTAPNSMNYFETFEASTTVNRSSARTSIRVAQPRLTPPPRSSMQAKTQLLLAHANVVCNTLRTSARAASRRAARQR